MFRTDLDCYSKDSDGIIIDTIFKSEFQTKLEQLNEFDKTWLQTNNFNAEEGQVCIVPDKSGKLKEVYFGLGDKPDLYTFAKIVKQLPPNVYRYKNPTIKKMIAWGLDSYNIKKKNDVPKLNIDKFNADIIPLMKSIYWVRDLINTPSNILGPVNVAAEATILKGYGAKVKIISGKALEKKYPSVHAVGRASERGPCFIDITWGIKKHKKVTLVGKGVCFDTGGLNLKPKIGMKNMKKDMAGAAHVLGLARLIMAEQLPIYLRVLIPVVDNFVSGSALCPGDIINTKSGKTVEITDTDAEGRVILADALTEASSEEVDYLVDFTTLTGAARVALGTEISMFTSNQPTVSEALLKIAHDVQDPIWEMPLYENYYDLIKSPVADLQNSSNTPYGGALTAALFLKQFVRAKVWIHFDIMAWNERSSPGRPMGGEAMGFRAVYRFLKSRIAN